MLASTKLKLLPFRYCGKNRNNTAFRLFCESFVQIYAAVAMQLSRICVCCIVVYSKSACFPQSSRLPKHKVWAVVRNTTKSSSFVPEDGDLALWEYYISLSRQHYLSHPQVVNG